MEVYKKVVSYIISSQIIKQCSFTLRVGGCWYGWIWQFDRLTWSAFFRLNFCLNRLKHRQFFLVLVIHVKKPFLVIGGAWSSCIKFLKELSLIKGFTSGFTSAHCQYRYKFQSVQEACTKCFVVHIWKFEILQITWKKWNRLRVSVQGVKSFGSHFACLCRGFEFYEVKKMFCYYFSKRKWKCFYTFNHFYSEKSSKRAK